MPAGVSETRVIDSLLTTTVANYQKTLQEQIFDEYPLLSWLNGKLGVAMRGATVKEVVQGGESIVVPLLYEQNSTVNSYSGYEQLDTMPQEGLTHARYAWKQYAGSVSISGHEERANRGEAKMISLLQAKMTQLEMSLRDRLNRDAYADGTGNGGKNLTGLAALISGTTTVGGLNPSTYTWWKPYTKTSPGSFASNGRAEMMTAYNSISYGNAKPEVIFTDLATYQYYDTSLEEKQRFVYTGTNKSVADAGFAHLAWNGTPIFFDRDCTAGAMYFLTSKAIKFMVMSGADFTPTPFIKPENQDARTCQILFEGNIVVTNRRKLGVISGFTA